MENIRQQCHLANANLLTTMDASFRNPYDVVRFSIVSYIIELIVK